MPVLCAWNSSYPAIPEGLCDQILTENSLIAHRKAFIISAFILEETGFLIEITWGKESFHGA
jgi:hypothetical protein